MPKYEVFGKFIGSKRLGVFEADTPEDALAMALESDENYISIPHSLDWEMNDSAADDGWVELVEEKGEK